MEPNPNPKISIDLSTMEMGFPDGRRVVVHHLVMGTARVCLLDRRYDTEVEDSWEYEDFAAAVAAVEAWAKVPGKPEPDGWFRNPQTGRRRPGGDPAKEYIRR